MNSCVLLIDIGNSRVKWAITHADSLQEGAAFSVTATLPEGLLSSLWQDLSPPDAVWIANVARAEVVDTISAWLHQHWSCPIYHARSEAQAFDVFNAYQKPEKLGVDRWLSLLAVRQICSGSVCMVSCGTALTVDVMNAEGIHLGGVISPGLGLMTNALMGGTEGLKHLGLSFRDFARMDQCDDVDSFLGQTTATGVARGCLFACTGLVWQIHRRFPQSRLILTGGDAELLARNLDLSCQIEPRLVLQGLWRLSAEASSKTGYVRRPD